MGSLIDWSLPPNTAGPSTASPSTPAPTTLSPSTAAPTTPAPTASVRPSRREMRHHEIIILVILFAIILFAVFVFALLWKYNRSKMRYLYYRMKYFLCCCRLSEEDIQRQNEEDDTPLFDTLNDLLFGINENGEVGRVNISALTNDDGEGDDSTPLPLEVSVESFFPDLLAGVGNSNNNNQMNDENNNNNLQEPLLNARRDDS